MPYGKKFQGAGFKKFKGANRARSGPFKVRR